MKKIFNVIIVIGLVFTSCKKDPVEDTKEEPKTPVSTEGSLVVAFDNVFDSLTIAMDTQNYVLPNGNKITFSKLKYYISNIKVTAQDGSVYSETESYHLIDQSIPSSLSFALSGVPFKTYSSVSFMIGVDSARNVSGAQTGALSASNNMFWTWNTGYIMAKIEGFSQQSIAAGNAIAFHIGGFKGQYSALKNVNLAFNGTNANVSTSVTPKVHIKCNLVEWFTNPVTIDFSSINNITMVNATSKMIADNYADMFTIDHIQN